VAHRDVIRQKSSYFVDLFLYFSFVVFEKNCRLSWTGVSV